MAAAMGEIAKTLPGYIGIESTRDADGFAITVSYWESEEAIKGWREHAKHAIAQKIGKERCCTGRGLHQTAIFQRVFRMDRAF